MKRLFITGTMRSGTTLVEKLVSTHPNASILSQPFPLLMVEIKRRFLASRGELHDPYPLGDLFLEARYRQEDWRRFLASLDIDREGLRASLLDTGDYSGQYVRFPREVLLDAIESAPDGFVPMLVHLWDRLAGSDGVTVVGAKEISGEEYLEAFEANDVESLVVLRDPRDIVASLHSGRSAEFAGRARPLLFTVRQWRKSVAAAIAAGARRSAVKYEDVVASPAASLEPVLARCGLTAGLVDPSRLRDSQGMPWTGNSSYGERLGVDGSSAGAFERVLPRSVASFVEATCLPEMRCAGYPTRLGVDEAIETIRGFEEPYALERPELSHLVSRASRDEEIERLERLRRAAAGEEEETAWFLSPATGRALREVL